MPRTWGVSFGETERMELERIVMDSDEASALKFVKGVIYPKVRESEKPGSCFHDVEKTVEEVDRPIKKHTSMGSGD